MSIVRDLKLLCGKATAAEAKAIALALAHIDAEPTIAVASRAASLVHTLVACAWRPAAAVHRSRVCVSHIRGSAVIACPIELGTLGTHSSSGARRQQQ